MNETPIKEPKYLTIAVNNSTSKETKVNNNEQVSTETNKEDKKSNNANLSNLGIRPNDFSGFKAATTSYNVTVPKDVAEVELYATAQDSKATVTGTGKKKLEIGKNELSVTVKAEDGTTKTYKVNVIRDESEAKEDETEEPDEDPDKISQGLAQLKFDGLELKPEFKTDVYEYEVDYKGEETTFNVTAIATDVNYNVEVVGNEGLKDGENYITVLVSDKDGKNVATYQVKVNKNVITDSDIKEAEKKVNDMKKMALIVSIGIGILLLIIIITVIVKRVKNQEDDWDSEDDEARRILEYRSNNQLEDFDNDMKYTKKEEQQEDSKEIEEETKTRKHKGKRFK